MPGLEERGHLPRLELAHEVHERLERLLLLDLLLRLPRAEVLLRGRAAATALLVLDGVPQKVVQRFPVGIKSITRFNRLLPIWLIKSDFSLQNRLS